ncbi:hypothetical protein [Azospirillum sp. ST 5-10]|uniref:hypothetical protein n=1 Tax=unclassified Azospirillum TaxID=2630922 RepID=UPI003F49D00A
METDRSWRSVEWEGRVRFRIPPDWIALTERAEGHDVAVFRPAADAGELRVLVDERAPRAGGTAAALLHEMTMRFVRPDDARVGDRTVERRADGATLAMAVLVAEEDGRAETHYLWLVGAEREGSVRVAMFSFALPAACDGRAPYVDTLAALDAAVRAADLLADAV